LGLTPLKRLAPNSAAFRLRFPPTRNAIHTSFTTLDGPPSRAAVHTRGYPLVNGLLEP
jgi:hypothetical protein